MQESASLKSFKFGPSMNYLPLKQGNIPVNISGMTANILTDVVACEVPLLLSRKSMKDANCVLYFVSNIVDTFGKDIPLQHTSIGHYCSCLTANCNQYCLLV